MTPRFTMRTYDDQWLWEFRDKTGRVVARSTERYKNKKACMRAIAYLKTVAPKAQIYDGAGQPTLRPVPK